jgi:hypothetical protein
MGDIDFIKFDEYIKKNKFIKNCPIIDDNM